MPVYKRSICCDCKLTHFAADDDDVDDHDILFFLQKKTASNIFLENIIYKMFSMKRKNERCECSNNILLKVDC